MGNKIKGLSGGEGEGAMKAKRAIKHFRQRIFRGFSDADTWDLGYIIAKFTLPRLKRFKQIEGGYPSELTEEKWNVILDKMIWSFEFILTDENTELYPTKSVKETIDKEHEGLVLFGEWFTNLWW